MHCLKSAFALAAAISCIASLAAAAEPLTIACGESAGQTYWLQSMNGTLALMLSQQGRMDEGRRCRWQRLAVSRQQGRVGRYICDETKQILCQGRWRASRSSSLSRSSFVRLRDNRSFLPSWYG